MAFAHVLASNGVGYFLCSLGYFFLGIIIVTQLNRETHLPSGLKAFKVLAYYGFLRGTFYFGELLFLISFQQVTPFTIGSIHELVWVIADYLTVLVFFTFAFRILLNSGYHNALQTILSGLLVYWTTVILVARYAGLQLTNLSTLSGLKPFLICVPSMLIIVLAFRHLSRRMQVLGFTRRSQLLKRLSLAYSVQALLVTTMASLNISLLPRLNLLGLEMTNNNVPILRLLSAIVLMTIVYLVYSLVSAGNQPESEDAPTQVETDLINDLALSLANQICNVLDVDTVAFFLRRPPADAEVLCAIQGAPLNMPILSGEILTRAKLQEYLSRKYKAVHTVPIEASSVQLGTILIANRKRRPLSPSDTRFLYSIANQTGRTVLGLRSLVDQIEVKAIQEERLRISREMHDGLSPLLAYMRFRIEAAKDMLAASDHNPVAHTFEEIDEVISEAFADVRESIVGLRSSIADESLLDKLKESVEQFAKLTNIRVITDFPKEMPVLHPKTEIQVLRIVQEMLTNVRKHAEATVVKVAVIKGNNELIFEVADNGRGFNQSDVLDGHFGLATMRERSNDIGGRLSVRSKPGEGTRVTLVLPPDGKERTINDAEAVNSRRPRAVPRGTGEPSLIKR